MYEGVRMCSGGHSLDLGTQVTILGSGDHYCAECLDDLLLNNVDSNDPSYWVYERYEFLPNISDAISILNGVMGSEEARYKHSMGVAMLVNGLLKEDNAFKTICVRAAILHDIGYAKGLIETGFHPIDGYSYLNSQGVEEVTQQVALRHSLAGQDCWLNHQPLFRDWYEYDPAQEYLSVINLVSYADWHTNGKGELVSVDERYADIKERHGEDSKVWKYMQGVRYELDYICKAVENALGLDYSVGQVKLGEESLV